MSPLEWALAALSVPVVMASAYLLLLAVLSTRRAPPPAVLPRVRFDVVVPAHDEGPGIGATVRSLLELDYPRDLFRVLVVADNCVDDTAARALGAGAHVLVRDEPSLRGKGHALARAFESSLRDGWADAVVVVDADTRVSLNLLASFSAHLAEGATAVQADYAVSNPDASWRTRLMAIALACIHTLRSVARERMALSAGLRGNGMCFTSALLREVPHHAFSVVEDLEYGISLGEAGHRVTYAEDAHVYGEMPTSEAASRTQRDRWEGGRGAMVRRHAGPLLLRGLRRGDRVCFDLGVDLLVPPLATLLAAVAWGLSASILLSWARGALVGVIWLWVGSAVALVAYALRGWQLSGTGLRGLASAVYVPRYVAWKLLVAIRRSGGKPTEWVRTARSGEEEP